MRSASTDRMATYQRNSAYVWEELNGMHWPLALKFM